MEVKNRSEPIKFSNLRIDGFAAENAKPGDHLRILTRVSLTSDRQEFHVLANSIASLLIDAAARAGIAINPERHSSILLVIHADHSADLYLDAAATSLQVIIKRSVVAGEPIFQRDIADVRALNFPAITFVPTDKVLYCFRVKWKFGLFFDLGTQRELDVSKMERDIGRIHRILQYQDLYEALGDTEKLNQLVATGWFPFIEISTEGFGRLLQALSANFDLAIEEKTLLEKFDSDRIDRMAERWFRKSQFASRREVLQAGLDAFKRGDSVSCIKILLTEIEGIIRDSHIASLGKSAKILDLLEFAISEGIKKTDEEATLFFPSEFATYLLNFTFAKFDPLNPSDSSISRHSVGHGAANSASYTKVRALQAILTIDQLSYFL